VTYGDGEGLGEGEGEGDGDGDGVGDIPGRHCKTVVRFGARSRHVLGHTSLVNSVSTHQR
jgi:hypothetical protein